ncbi:MAG: UDP-N-acetylglucosamine pyrophosphorylase [Oscillospiraceae bacterium]|nr:UDP-N-acetylglucosamine pyrophosphorylase [Oscillospiraceae bacterium]
MSLNIDYYFRKPEKFPIPGFLDGLTEAWEILTRAKELLTEDFIDESADIRDGATIMGPVYIGKNVEIMPGALIRPYTIIGDNCSVGHGSELKHAVLFGGAKVASLSFVGDSVLGASARIASGVITGNRKFDQTEVALKLGGEKHGLGSDFFGLILGDSSRLGANCTTQPGTHIGPNSWIFPQICVRGFIQERVRVTEERRLRYSENTVVELKP